MRLRGIVVLLALTLMPAAYAGAVCIPADGAAGQSIYAQILAVPDAATPYAIVRCGINGPRAALYAIPTIAPAPDARIVSLDGSWDAFWEATDPRAVTRELPTAMAGERPTHDLDPPVAGRIGAPSGPVLDAELGVLGEEHGTGISLRLVSTDGTEPAWLPTVRLPLVRQEDGNLALPIAPMSADGPPTAIHLTVLANDRYVAPSGFDAWAVVDRPPNGIAEAAALVAPDPVLVVPNFAFAYAPEIRAFPEFYEQRIVDATGGFTGPVQVLQYGGTVGESDRTLVRPPALGVHGSGNRAIRVRLDQADGAVLRLVDVQPVFYRALWVSLPDNPDAVVRRPDELDLNGDEMLFRFGAEMPSELTEGMVAEALNQHLEVLAACDPRPPAPLPVDIQLVVEPGGTVLGVFVSVADVAVAQCLIDGLSDLLFPLATGRPVAVRFPLTYGQR